MGVTIHGGPLKLTCDLCGESFEHYPSGIKGKKQFCSPEWLSETFIGESHLHLTGVAAEPAPTVRDGPVRAGRPQNVTITPVFPVEQPRRTSDRIPMSITSFRCARSWHRQRTTGRTLMCWRISSRCVRVVTGGSSLARSAGRCCGRRSISMIRQRDFRRLWRSLTGRQVGQRPARGWSGRCLPSRRRGG